MLNRILLYGKSPIKLAGPSPAKQEKILLRACLSTSSYLIISIKYVQLLLRSVMLLIFIVSSSKCHGECILKKLHGFSCITAPRLFNLFLYCDKSVKHSLLCFIISFTSSYSSIYSYSISFPISKGSPLMEVFPHKLVALSLTVQTELFVKLKMWGCGGPKCTCTIALQHYNSYPNFTLHLFTINHIISFYLPLKHTSWWRLDGEKWSGLAQLSENQMRKELHLDWGLKHNLGVCQNATKLNLTLCSESFTF